jgi:hypothetical protein
MPTIARLGPDGIYLGIRTVDSLSDGDVPVPVDCDLRPGRYRWSSESRAFEPLTLGPRQTLEIPNVLRALAVTIRSIRDGQPLPQEALEFVAWYERRFEQP